MKTYQTYLFDFDYTLADSSRGIVICFRNVLERHGFHHIDDHTIKRTIGKTLPESFSILTGVTDTDTLETFRKEYVKEADQHMTVNTRLFQETEKVLHTLKAKGAAIGIISTKYRYRILELVPYSGTGRKSIPRRILQHHCRRRRCQDSQTVSRRFEYCHRTPADRQSNDIIYRRQYG